MVCLHEAESFVTIYNRVQDNKFAGGMSVLSSDLLETISSEELCIPRVNPESRNSVKTPPFFEDSGTEIGLKCRDRASYI